MSTKRILCLSDVLRHAATARLVVRCEGCPRVVRFSVSELAGFYGGGMSVHSLRFKCDECGAVTTSWELEQARDAPARTRPRPIDG